MRHFIVLALAVALACTDTPVPVEEPSVPDSVPVEVVPDSAPRPAEPKIELPSGRVAPAQKACENSLTVNGIPALPGANYVTVDRLPRQLKIEFVDCPHPEAVVRGNYTRTGYGTGEVQVQLNPVHRSTDGVVLANQGATVTSGRLIIATTNARLMKAVTKPTGFPLPTGIATEPVKAVWTIAVRGGSEPAELKVSQRNSEIRENGRIGTRALVIRESE